MNKIQRIIAAIDAELERTGKDYLTAIEAAALLDKLNILKDSSSRPGLPLRKLLRAGKIPHAYQNKGKNSKWIIPHSKTGNKNKSREIPQRNKKVDSKINTLSNVNVEKISKLISKAREKYKPEKIKYLLIAEAPPDNLERFFYYPDVPSADYLFLGVISVLYPADKIEYLDNFRSPKLKETLLNKLKDEGFYLIDLLDVPKSYYKGILQNASYGMMEKIKKIADNDTRIILIKANIYDIMYKKLKTEGLNVINKRIEFPASGNQKKFYVNFKDALIKAEYFK